MCGIIGILSKEKINLIKYLINGLKQLQNRGYDSAGITYYNNNNFNTIKYASDKCDNSISKIEKEVVNINLSNKINLGMGHTRWATHGAKTDYNSHPHVSFNNKVIVVHNGIIENYLKLKNELIKNNIPFKSETDSEVISNLIAYYYSLNNSFLDSIKITLSKLEGTWGLVIINTDTPNKLYCVRRGSPLLISNNNDFVIISSEQSGFNGQVSNYFILEGNDLCEIYFQDDEFKIKTSYNYKLKDTIKNNFDLTPYPYDHWTIKEIEEQYESSLRALSFGGRILNEDKVKLGGLENHIETLKTIENIIFLGCGTSYNASMIGVNYFKENCNFNCVMVFDGAEFNSKDIPKLGKTALILLSQSGETRDLYRCVKIGRDENLFLIGIINVVDSLIAREVDCGVYLNAGREVGVASTKCFTNQVIILSMMSIWFNQIHNKNENKRKDLIFNLRKLPNQIKETINMSKNNLKIFNEILNKDNLFLLGKGKSEAIAREGSLKIKEISYIHSEAYNGSSLKHGPFALLSEEFPVILIILDDDHYTKMMNCYQEIKSRGSPIVLIKNSLEINDENVIKVPYNKYFGDLLSIIPLQIISYNLSLVRNLNPDFPRNLAKSVVVE